jgi:hypothetical protein
LCEEAKELLQEAISLSDCKQKWMLVDIGGNDELIERYGLRIPVLENEVSGAQLNWPFDAAMLKDFLRANRLHPAGKDHNE